MGTYPNTFMVVLWGIGDCVMHGPFAEAETATEWLNDYSFEDDDDCESGLVIECPVIAVRMAD